MSRFETRKATREKRKDQICKVFSVKIDKSHLNKASKHHLFQLFKEAKWFYNYCLSCNDITKIDTKIKTVSIKIKEQYENRTFAGLSSQMKQAIKDRLIFSLKSLSSLKKKGHKVGRLKFKGLINSITLNQYGKTYFIENNRIRIQKLKSWLRVRGLNQIPKEAEFANAVLLHKNSDYYLNITTYVNKKAKKVPNTSIGIDFGCETQLTFSNGIKVKFQVPISKKLRRLDRKIQKSHRKNSKNKEKDKRKRLIEYRKLTNKKKDIRRKLVNVITKNYEYVCFQDESIHAWRANGHGKKIQNSGIGGILSDLKHKSVTPIIVDRFFPSTQLCFNCGNKQKLGLNERTYRCNCSYVEDRDVKSALCIEAEGMKQVPMDHREFKLGEIQTSTFFDILMKIDSVIVSKLESRSQEASF